MKKNWTSLIMSAIAAVIIVLMVMLVGKLLNGIMGTMGSSDPSMRRVLVEFVNVYKTIGWVFAGIVLALGLLGVFKKIGNTLLSVFGILMIIFGGLVIFLIPGILCIIAGNKGKAKFVKYEAEKAAAEKYAANQQ